MNKSLLDVGGAVIRGAKAFVRPAVFAGVAVALVAAPGTAWASPPDHGTFSSHEVFADPDVCAPEGFSVDVVEDEVSDFQVFFNADGDITFVQVHVDYRGTISANGHTIVERDRWMDVFYPDGSARTVGNTVHIQGPGPGLVQHDAGQIVFGTDGSVQAIHGPHPQFEGQTFCFALRPWGGSHPTLLGKARRGPISSYSDPSKERSSSHPAPEILASRTR